MIIHIIDFLLSKYISITRILRHFRLSNIVVTLTKPLKYFKKFAYLSREIRQPHSKSLIVATKRPPSILIKGNVLKGFSTKWPMKEKVEMVKKMNSRN